MGAFSRHAYYLSDAGQVIGALSVRSGGTGIWAEIGNPTWILSLEQTREGVRVAPGPEYTKQREVDAMLLEYSVPTFTKEDLGQHVPENVRRMFREVLRRKIQRALLRVRRDWDQHASEQSVVGALITRLGFAFEFGGWRVSLRPQEFSSQVKEPLVGADVGWRIEIRSQDGATTKAMWMQAKRTELVDPDPFTLKDFAEQFAKMERRTEAAYGLILSRYDVAVVNRTSKSTLDNALFEAVGCHRGDRSRSVIAETLNSKYVVDIEIDGTKPPGSP
jgi:hypothetical protein